MSCYNSKRLVEWLDSFVLSVEETGYMSVHRCFNNYGAHLHVWIKDSISVEFHVSWHVLDTAARFSWVDRELGVVKPPSCTVKWLLNAALDEHFDSWNSDKELPQL